MPVALPASDAQDDGDDQRTRQHGGKGGEAVERLPAFPAEANLIWTPPRRSASKCPTRVKPTVAMQALHQSAGSGHDGTLDPSALDPSAIAHS
jgi:hypothetical protein